LGNAPAGFEGIHKEFRPRIVRYLGRLVGEADAEDLAQEVFIKVHGSLSGFRGESSLSTWIYRIATNTALDRLKSPACRREITADTDELEEGRTCVSGADVPVDQQIAREQMSACVRGIMDRLSPDHKAVIVLSELGELTDREVADVLGVTPGAAKARLHRARARLKGELEAACNFGRDERNEFVCEPKTTPITLNKK
jgi:RNA polymerase sigma-70 factor, ECF subfamily